MNIEPFVRHLNELEGHQFAFSRCLDVEDRESKQPEVLYLDAISGAELVVERKSLVWPKDAVAEHRNEHLLAEELTRELTELVGSHPVDIEISQVRRMPKQSLIEIARDIAAMVRSSLPDLLAGRIVGSRASGPVWGCRINPVDRHDEGGPDTGLLIRFLTPGPLPDLDDRGLHTEVERLLRSASDKLQSHSTRRRILLLDPFGSLRSIGIYGLSYLLERVYIPSLISEIWRASYDWVTEDDQGWLFERILPKQAQAAS